MKGREQFAGRCRGLSTHPSGQREELTVAGAGLGDPVGIEEQQVAGGEVEGVDAVVIADQLREAEQRRGSGGLKYTESPAVQEQWRGCPQLRMPIRLPPCGISTRRAVAKRSIGPSGGKAAL